MTLHEILTVTQLAGPPILGAIAWFLKGLHGSMQDVADQLRLLNGRMVKLEEWRQMHDGQDLEREERGSAERRELKEDLHRVHDLMQRQITEITLRRANGSQER